MTSTALVVPNPTDILPGSKMSYGDVGKLTGFEMAELALIHATVAKDAKSLPDLALFLHGARRLGLDPLARQIYWIVREGKGGIQVGIDGFRTVAARSGEYAGSEPPEFRGWKELAESGRKIQVPECARVIVWRIVQGRKCAFTGEAYWDEFYPGDKQGFMWRKMPRNQLAKCAEAQALRKAFPAELMGLPSGAPVDAEDIPGPSQISEIRTDAAPRRALTAARYDDIEGTEDDAQDPMGAAARRGARSQKAAPSEPQEAISSVDDDEYQAYQTLTEKAQAREVDYDSFTVPCDRGDLRKAHADLESRLAERESESF